MKHKVISASNKPRFLVAIQTICLELFCKPRIQNITLFDKFCIKWIPSKFFNNFYWKHVEKMSNLVTLTNGDTIYTAFHINQFLWTLNWWNKKKGDKMRKINCYLQFFSHFCWHWSWTRCISIGVSGWSLSAWSQLRWTNKQRWWSPPSSGRLWLTWWTIGIRSWWRSVLKNNTRRTWLLS